LVDVCQDVEQVSVDDVTGEGGEGIGNRLPLLRDVQQGRDGLRLTVDILGNAASGFSVRHSVASALSFA
jgi:hypothetical protein